VAEGVAEGWRLEVGSWRLEVDSSDLKKRLETVWVCESYFVDIEFFWLK